MAKRKKKKMAKSAGKLFPPPISPLPAPQLAFGFDPSTPTVQRKITRVKEGWSEFKLDDGSLISTKAVILDVKRATGQFNIDGNPVYVMQMTMVHQLKAPPSLRKKTR